MPSRTEPRSNPLVVAFTLVELVAVVVCIGLLGAILQPSVQDAIGGSRRLKCLERLHKIGEASLIYSADDPAFAAIPVHRWQNQQDPQNPSFIGAYDWGGKSGIGQQDYLAEYAGTVYGSRYGTAAGFGPARRPLNMVLYPFGFADNGSAAGHDLNRAGAQQDTRLELEAFLCPADDRPPLGAHCPDWIQHERRSSFEHFGTSYAANIFMVSSSGEMFSNSPYLRPVTRVLNPARTIAYEENIGRWAWACRREQDGCEFIGEGVDPKPAKALPGWHGKDWTFNRVFIDAHAATQRVYIERTEDRDGYAQHYYSERLSEYPDLSCSPGPPETGEGAFQRSRCIIVRGDGWQKDTLPDQPVCTGLVSPCQGRPSYECCVQPSG